LDRANDDFGSSGIFELRLFIHWGVKDIDKSNVGTWETRYIGDAVFDPSFDISQPAA